MVPLVGLIRVLRATVEYGHEAADWIESREGAAAMAAAYPDEKAGISVDASSTTQ